MPARLMSWPVSTIAVPLARGKNARRLALTLKVHTIISSKNFRKNRPGLRDQDLQPASGPL
ncbi:hypothetical protein CBM2589_A10077 [Cupriavidus taiwanensis]|uniref:Uncharacterized protein n=1 Tax=Cupriavidus taiwanensis TaxID=164546 RepID=A0A375BYB7_9BURK|nr:hypothetical protein CBM2589_A10077 [Cupriavidus taiwanensis]